MLLHCTFLKSGKHLFFFPIVFQQHETRKLCLTIVSDCCYDGQEHEGTPNAHLPTHPPVKLTLVKPSVSCTREIVQLVNEDLSSPTPTGTHVKKAMSGGVCL